MAFSLLADPFGKDASLVHPHCCTPKPCRGNGLVLQAHYLYCIHRDVISPADGPRSHYRPSSATYMQRAMEKYGFFYGFALGCDRLMRENSDPWIYPTIICEDDQITKVDFVP